MAKTQNANKANAVPDDISRAILAAHRIALAGHVTPDADCLGSMGALALGLKDLGKSMHVAMPAGSISRRLSYLTDLFDLQPATTLELQACDLLIGLDTAKDRRLNIDGKLDALPGIPVLNVDHHATNTRFGKWNWVAPEASSVCELVVDLIAALGCPLTPTMATLLYAGIHGDTQGFSLSNTSTKSLAVAHVLAASGARIPEVCEKLQRSHSRSEFELLKVIYGNARVSADGRLAWSTASHEEITAAGCVAEDIDNQVEIPRSVEGIRVAILFTEGVPGKIRMNFRGERGAAVLELAREFGGGGHPTSAGAILDGSIAAVTEQVLAKARAFVAELSR